LGWHENPAAVVVQAKLFVHPALHEGVPNALLEALALGVPVLAADIPELREVLQDDVLLFDPHSPTQLASRISEFFKDPKPITEASYKAAKRLRFDWNSEASVLV
jgi:glycosyltransferase involved in cell wall biosynthesis